jgi:hypothetical protein
MINMNLFRSFHNPAVSLAILAGLSCWVVFGSGIVMASPIPQIKVPNVWELAGQALDSAWSVDNNEWSYLEYGEVRSLRAQVLSEDLRRGGWSGISIGDHIDSLDLLADWLSRSLPIDFMLSECDLPKLSIGAKQGPWQLVTFILDEGDSGRDYPDESAYHYMAIITHESHLGADINRLVIEGYQAVPGSKMVEAYFYNGVEGDVGLYIFQTMSPSEAVIAHHARMQDWEIYPLGVLGTFGYNESNSLLLTVHPPTDDLEGTFYTIIYSDMADLGEDGEW